MEVVLVGIKEELRSLVIIMDGIKDILISTHLRLHDPTVGMTKHEGDYTVEEYISEGKNKET